MSPGIKYDVSDVEARPGSGLQPTPGMYDVKVTEARQRTKKNDGTPVNDIELILDVINDDEFGGARLWSYVGLDEQTRWKLRELTDALGLPPKGVLDVKKQVEAKTLRVKVNEGSYEGEYRAKVGRFYAIGEGGEVGPDGEIDLTDTTAVADEYDTWTAQELAAEIEARGLDMPSGRKTIEKLATVLRGHDSEQAGDGAEPDAGPEDDYDTWDMADLTAEIESRGITVSGRKSQQKYVDALREHDVAQGGEPESEAAVVEPDDYDEWPLNELEEEAEVRGIKITGRKTEVKYIEAFRKYDQENLFSE